MNEICMCERAVKNQNKIVSEIRLKLPMFLLHLCNMFVSSINVRWVSREVLKTRPLVSVFNTFLGTQRMLMHEKNMFEPYIHFHPYYRNDLKFSDRQVWEGP